MGKGISELEYWGVHYFHELYVELYNAEMNSDAMKQHLINRWGVQIVEEYWQLYQQKIHTAFNRMNEIGV